MSLEFVDGKPQGEYTEEKVDMSKSKSGGGNCCIM